MPEPILGSWRNQVEMLLRKVDKFQGVFETPLDLPSATEGDWAITYNPPGVYIFLNGEWKEQKPQGFPVGTIAMWYGDLENLPPGWVLCDGNNGTPDLRDRFIIGAGGNRNLGATGGQTSHTHNHTVYSIGKNSDAALEATNALSGDFGPLPGPGEEKNNHTHSLSSSTTGSATITTLPPYRAVYFIMYKSEET